MRQPKTIFTTLHHLLIFLSCVLAFGCEEHPQDLRFQLVNPIDLHRNGEVVTINVKGMNLSKHYTASSDAFAGLPVQHVDLDQDGLWDQLLIALDFGPAEQKEVSFLEAEHQSEESAANSITFSVRKEGVYTGLEIHEMDRKRGAVQAAGDPFFHLEGPGIENDKVAFRTFFDPRNGKDIYGKLTEQPVLKRAGIASSWHKPADWGMDILQVGKSLGAGGLAVSEEGQLYRLGDADKSRYQLRYEGSLAAAHRITFTGWDAGSKKINGYEQLTLQKGNYYYHNEIGLSDSSLTLAVGMPNFKSDTLLYTRHNDKLASIWTYAPQADGTATHLGMAIMFAHEQYQGHDAIRDGGAIANTSYVKLSGKGHNDIWFFACWEMSDEYFSTQEHFERYLQQEADKLSNKIEIIRI
ncbi:DUF4861 family protein [Marinoscillum furvescens]|uniref:Uncharacterized protein DUF4861 n=1 Tax=Marinoscillum furvescens DSM 4134 TaxID=1122208 RepID=A0A3D9L5K4_MARFU|nr:DUF4861 family protein [Marinoscillum furvescens]REE00084.1 uncharacterized protein DUF4861 [Marinoscillum furvescens DSM 4134]